MAKHGLSVKDVSELTDVSVNSIRRILDDTYQYRTHYKVAELIAEGLYVDVYDIFHPMELSELGRPGGTGGNTIERTAPLRLVESYETTCTKHFTVYPRSAGCEECA